MGTGGDFGETYVAVGGGTLEDHVDEGEEADFLVDELGGEGERS